MEATPRPWKMEDTGPDIHNQDEFVFHVVGPDYDTDYKHLVLDNENYYPHDVSRINAELIVQCVNAHDNLVASLEAVEWSKYHIDSGGCTALCGGNRDQGHTDDCQLAATLAKAKKNIGD